MDEGDGPANTDTVVLTAKTLPKPTVMRGAMIASPATFSATRLKSNDDESVGLTHTFEVVLNAPERIWYEMMERSAKTTSPASRGTITHDKTCEAEMRDRSGSVAFTRLLHSMVDVASGAVVMTTTEKVDDPIDNE